MINSQQIVQCQALRFFGIARTGPFQECGPTFGKVASIAGAAGLFKYPCAKMAHLVLCNPKDTPPAQIRSMPALIVPEEAELPDGLEEFRMPGGVYASSMLTGSYSQLATAWPEFVEWVGLQKYASTQHSGCVSFEVYLSNPSQVEESELKTELFLPLEHPVVGVTKCSRVFPGVSVDQLFDLWTNDVTRNKLTCSSEIQDKPIPFEQGGQGMTHLEDEAGNVSFRFDQTMHQIIPGQRIVYSFSMWNASRERLKMQSTATIDFYPSVEGACMAIQETVIHFDGHDHSASHAQGYEAFLDKHQELLEERPRGL